MKKVNFFFYFSDYTKCNYNSINKLQIKKGKKFMIKGKSINIKSSMYFE